MTPERWRRANQLFHSACQLAPEERAAFIETSCADDEPLRLKLLAMLDAAQEDDHQFSAPVWEKAANAIPVAEGAEVAKKQLAAGQRIGHYEVLNHLESGGMGEVWLAYDTRVRRKVALKLLPARFTTDADRVRRFEQEAYATSALNHPNILTVHDIGDHEGAPYIVAELLEGANLRALLAPRAEAGGLPVRTALDYARQIATGLAAAHETGIVHRDLKPENLFVTGDGRVKILDFGLAKLEPQKFASGLDSRMPKQEHQGRLTDSRVIMGTVGYMSPEQARCEDVDHRSDLFSFGLILYEMLTGRQAFHYESMAETMAAILKEEPSGLAELSESNKQISPQLERIVQHCLEKKPELRFQSARDLSFALEALPTPSSARPRPQPASEPVNKTKRIWEFGPYRLDEAERLLLRDGSPVGLTPKVFDTLVALLEHSGRLVEKDELMARLWPDTFVEEGALTRNISDLRKALGEERYVETVPKRGYRFVAPVREISDESGALIAEKTTEPRLFIKEAEEEAWPSVLSLPRRAGSERSLKARLARTLAVAILIAGGALGLGRLLKSKTTLDETRHAFQAMQLSRFTASGNVLTAAISPDGKYVATALDENGLQSLWLRQAPAPTSGVRLVAPAPVEYWGLTFSNDSTFIYYVSWVRNQSDAELYELPVLGGAPRRIHVGNIDTPISFAPSGDRFAFVTSSSSRGEAYVKIANADEGAKTLVTRPNPGSIVAYPGGPAWSRDGRFIAYAASGSGADVRQQTRVFVANVEDKEERQLTGRGWVEIGRVAWLGDGSGLVISAREQKDAPRQLWFVSWPDGASRRITNDLHDYDSVSLSDDARTLAAVQIQAAFSIAVAPQGGDHRAGAVLSRPSEIFSEVSGGRPSVAWTPDNRLVYCSRASGAWGIWLMNKNGSDQRRLTIDPHNELFPAVSADGRHIFFASDKDGAFNIWRMEIDGRRRTRLTRGVNQILPEVTPDGRWVVYQQDGSGMDNTSLWRVAAAGGEPERLADNSLMRQRPAISPDGGLLAYVYMDEQGWGLAVRPLEGGETNRKFPFPSTISSRFFRWTPDGRALAYIVNEKGASNIWLQPLSGAPPGKLNNFIAGQLSSFAWSPDGQWLAYLRHTATRDVVLLKDFK